MTSDRGTMLIMSCGGTKYVHGIYDGREEAIAEANTLLRNSKVGGGFMRFSICSVGPEEELPIEPARVRKAP